VKEVQLDLMYIYVSEDRSVRVFFTEKWVVCRAIDGQSVSLPCNT